MDFLTRMAARALQVDQAVRPRPESVFEPQLPEAPPEYLPSAAAPVERVEQPRRQPAEPRAVRTIARLMQPAHEVEPPRQPQPASVRQIRERPEPSVAAPRPTPMPSPAAETPRAAVQAVEATEGPDTAFKPRESLPEQLSRVELVHRHEVTHRSLPVPREPIRPAVPPRATPRDRQAAPPAEPEVTIEVTIGRVDVRAVTPAASANRSMPRPVPALSLEEYLKQRNRSRS